MIRDGQRRTANPQMKMSVKDPTDAELEAVSDDISRFPAGGCALTGRGR